MELACPFFFFPVMPGPVCANSNDIFFYFTIYLRHSFSRQFRDTRRILIFFINTSITAIRDIKVNVLLFVCQNAKNKPSVFDNETRARDKHA